MRAERVQSGDADRLRAVRLRAIADAPFAFDVPLEEERARDDAFWQSRAAESEAGEKAATFLLTDEGADAGMAGAFLSGEAVATVWGMWVDPDVRGRDGGALLLSETVSWARSRGLPRLALHVVDDPRLAAATRLYRSFGFEPAGAAGPLRSDPSLTKLRMELAL